MNKEFLVNWLFWTLVVLGIIFTVFIINNIITNQEVITNSLLLIVPVMFGWIITRFTKNIL